MVSSVAFFEELTNAPDERTRMRLLAEALERLEHRPLPEGVATTQQLGETELRLRREIEELRKETAQLRVDVEGLRKDTAQLQVDVEELRKETAGIRLDVEKVRVEVASVKAETIKWIAGLLVAQGAAIIGAVAVLT